MKQFQTLPPIQLETTSGEKLCRAKNVQISVSQLEFMRILAGETAFLHGLSTRAAARFQREALAEFDRAFGPDGDGKVRDDIAAAVVRAADRMTINVNYNGRQVGPTVLWCFLPFLDAAATPTTLDLVKAEPKPEPEPRAA